MAGYIPDTSPTETDTVKPRIIQKGETDRGKPSRRLTMAPRDNPAKMPTTPPVPESVMASVEIAL